METTKEITQANELPSKEEQEAISKEVKKIEGTGGSVQKYAYTMNITLKSKEEQMKIAQYQTCLLYTSPSPRD